MAGSEIGEIRDFQDVVRLLEAHPEWRAELRRLILTDEILTLPEKIAHLTEQVAALVVAQARSDAKLEALIEAQGRTEARLEALAEVQVRTEGRMDALIAQMTTLTAQMVELTRIVQRHSDDLGRLKGWGMETRFRTHCGAFFGEFVRRPRPLSNDELSDLVEDAMDRGQLSDADAVTLLRTDLVVRGTRKVDGIPVHLVIEVSWTVDTYDVERAAHRAALLAKLGIATQPVVAGATIRPAAVDLAFGLQVRQVIDKEAALPED